MASSTAPPGTRSITAADVAHRPAPGTTAPTSSQFRHDGAIATFLLAEHGELEQSLHVLDVDAGVVRRIPTPGVAIAEAALTLEERLRRERSRQLGTGVTTVVPAGRSTEVLVPLPDGLWLFDDLADPDRTPRRIVAADELDDPILDPAISADGATVGFVSGDEVWVVATAHGSPPRPVTAGAGDAGVTHGLAEFMAAEEMGRAEGFWLDSDGATVAFCEVDERHIPRYRIVHQGSDSTGDDAWEEHSYPFAGARNAIVSVGVVTVPADATTRAPEPVWLDLDATGIGADRYVARVQWSPDGEVWVQLQDRSQQRLDLVAFDPATGAGRLVLTETSDVWINLHDMLRFVSDGRFLWANEASGFRHLEVRDRVTGELVRRLTDGGWMVTRVVAASNERVWFESTRPTARQRRLSSVTLAGGDVVDELDELVDLVDGGDGPGEPVDDSRRAGVHSGVHHSAVHADSGTILDVASRPDRPPVTRLTTSILGDADGDAGTGSAEPVVVHDAAEEPAVAEFALHPPRPLTVTAADGTPLHGAVYEPAGDGPHPLVVWTYGGPCAQIVTDGWALTAAMRAQYLRQLGFVVAVVDGRGSTARGLAFEGHLQHRMGTVEVDDQVALVETLVADGLPGGGTVDAHRVGIYGWSYGGYLSLMCLAQRPDVFAAACAGAPVTSWDGYDTHYTERYMGTPAENPDGYAHGSVMTHTNGFRDRRMLLIHGLIDENVHFRHTARLLNALHRHHLDHELVLYPDERHVPRSEDDRRAMEERVAAFFSDALTR